MVTNGKTYFNCTLNKVIDNDTNFHFYSCFNIPKILINTFKIVRYNNLFCTDFFHAQKLFFTFFEIRLANHTCLYSVGAERGIKILRFVQGGGVNMKPTSFENAIRLQFDTLMKKVIDGIIKNYEKELDRRSNREIPFCELPKIVVNSFPVFDDYELDITIFDVYGMEARVSGNPNQNSIDVYLTNSSFLPCQYIPAYSYQFLCQHIKCRNSVFRHSCRS